MSNEQSFVNDLMKVMNESYKGVNIARVFDKWMIGLKSFDTLDDAKKWIDTFKK